MIRSRASTGVQRGMIKTYKTESAARKAAMKRENSAVPLVIIEIEHITEGRCFFLSRRSLHWYLGGRTINPDLCPEITQFIGEFGVLQV